MLARWPRPRQEDHSQADLQTIESLRNGSRFLGRYVIILYVDLGYGMVMSGTVHTFKEHQHECLVKLFYVIQLCFCIHVAALPT